MRVLVTGSRTWDRPEAVWQVLDIIAKEAAAVDDSEMVVVHGACPKGADVAAEWWVTRQSWAGIRVRAERHPADWERYGKSAGHRRNAEMVDLGADVVLAFHRGNSAGTRNCVEHAERAGLPVQIFQYAEAPEGAPEEVA